MKKIIKMMYLLLILAILFCILIVTFNYQQGLDVADNMFEELFDFMDLQSKWEFIVDFKAKVGILCHF